MSKRKAKPVPEVRCECGAVAGLKTGLEVYPHWPDLRDLLFYVCPVDGFKVGTHKGTKQPLGFPASPATQVLRRRAHSLFDPIWRAKAERDGIPYKMARGKGYTWLAAEMNIDVKDCHFGMFDAPTAQRAIEILEKFWPKPQPERAP